MKYFEKFDNYHQINERAINWSSDDKSGLSKMFSSIFSSIGFSIRKRKLKNLAKKYDEYLEYIYKEYLLEKKFNLDPGEIENRDLNAVLDEMEIESDKPGKEGSAEIHVDKQEMKNNYEIEAESDDLYKIKQDIHNNVNQQQIKDQLNQKKNEIQHKIDNNKNNTELVNKLKKKSEAVEKLRNELEKRDKKQDTEYIAKGKTYGVRAKPSKKIIQRAKEIPEEIDILKKNLKEVEKWISDLEKKQREAQQKIDFAKQDETKEEAEEDYKKATQQIEKHSANYREMNREIENLKEELKEIKQMYPNLETQQIKENNDNQETVEIDWSDEDRKKITKKINPYQIEEYYMKAEQIIDIDDQKKSKQLKNTWDLETNKVHKRWYYIFDIENLRNKTANIYDTKEQRNRKEESVKVEQTLQQLYKKHIKSYSSPYFRDLEKSDKQYYFFNFGDNRLILLKRLFFIDDRFAFRMIGELRFNSNKELVISENYKNVNQIIINNKKFFLYNEKNDYPVVFFSKNFIHSFSDLNSNINGINLKAYHLTAMTYKLASQILNKSNLRDVVKLNRYGEEVEEKIKKAEVK